MLKEILSISGKPGLQKLISNSSNAIIVESLIDGKRFPAYSNSKIIALEDISIYTEAEDMPLKEVFKRISAKENGKSALSHKEPTEKILAYFEEIVPEYDKERVYVSDMKKIIQWYNLLTEKGMLDLDEEAKEEEKKEIRHGKLVAVATGKVLAMTQAKDEAFATCAMGDGVVIEPEKGVIVAPADGKITALMKPSLHAIGIETKEGLNLLIHIGIDTVKLDGKGFKSFVKSGQEVKAGDKLVEFDINLIKKEGYSPDVMVVVLEDSNLPKVAYKTGEKTVAGKTVVAEF